MATQTTLGNTVRNNVGKVLNAGNASGTTRSLTLIDSTKHVGQFSGAGPQRHNESAFKGSAVSITSILQSGSTGYCLITKSSHGLNVGDILMVYGSNIAGYNTTHVVTYVVTANTVQTNVHYTADTATHGSYKVAQRNFNKMSKNEYIGPIIGNKIAGTATSIFRVFGRDNAGSPIATWKGYRRYNITNWNPLTGAATKGGNAGDLVKFHDIANDNDNLAFEPLPSRAVPGELVYRDGSPIPVEADYSPRTA